MAGCFAGTLGNNLFITGFKHSGKPSCIAPAFSAIFINPKKNTIAPASGKPTSSTEAFAESNMPSASVLKIVASLKKYF